MWRKLACPLIAVMALYGAPDPDPGVSLSLARERADLVGLHYQLSFRIPERKTEPVRGYALIRFGLATPRRVVLDFEAPQSHLLGVRIGEYAIEPRITNGHLILPASAMKTGFNTVTLEFQAGDDALNRNDEFLYTLFVPARAHRVFPCFDQPDLKASFTLDLDLPGSWEAVANESQRERLEAVPGRARVRFAETQPVSTYLFAFAAGRFRIESAERNGRTLRMFHRETDAQKVARNRDAIFDLHARALAWLSDYTGIEYPWGKFDFVLFPSFQFGGMEHPGAIFYNASSLLLDESATQNQYLNRASTISHETAHMWFGDLVTMRWFNDVWMKEVMANFMAAKIVNPSFPDLNHELRFLLDHYPAAYSIDRTSGANPIRQPLANLDEAGTLYGNIIYDKAPVVMQQLEMIVGETGFRDGLRQYLTKYKFGNADWQDLVSTLSTRTSENLGRWSREWVEQRGRPVIAATLRTGLEGTITRLNLRERDPLDRGLAWPQILQVTLGYPGRTEQLQVTMRGASNEIPQAVGLAKPLYALPGGAGRGYGLFLLDKTTERYLLDQIGDIPESLTRGSAWVTLWENVIEGRIDSADFLKLLLRTLPHEPDEQILQRELGYLHRVYWYYLTPSARGAQSEGIEELLREGLGRAHRATEKAAWFSTLRDLTITKEGCAWLERVWSREETIEGLPLAEPDEIALALELAVREVPGSQQVLATQRDRIINPDRKARFEFVMPALAADPAVREQAFERLHRPENRLHEAWVLESLAYLHHPLRVEHAERFVQPSLQMLREIQRTGDIFFPKRWMDATLVNHRSPAAARTVREFLTRESLPERLRWVVLSSADDLLRLNH